MSQMNHDRSMEQAELSAATKMAQEVVKNQSNTGTGNE
jgi:hypothetical protein